MSGVQANAVSRSAIDGSSSRGLNASAADVAKLSSSTMPTQLSTARSPASAPQNLNAKDEEVFAQAFAAAEQKWRARGMEPDLTSVMSMASEALARFRASGGN